jgi:RNA polymerase sigma-70 factor (ECF subfamily)
VEKWEDNRLIEACKQPNTKAFSILVHRYQSYAYAIALNYVKDKDDAEDIVQESFVKVVQSLKSFKGDSKFSTWLYSLVYFTSVDWIRKHRKTQVSGFSANEDTYHEIPSRLSVSADLDKKIRAEYIQKALKLLPEDTSMILNLFYYMDQSLDEIAKIMNTSENSMKVRLFRARAALKQQLDKLLDGKAKEHL